MNFLATTLIPSLHASAAWQLCAIFVASMGAMKRVMAPQPAGQEIF